MTNENVSKRLDGYWERPWNELPEEQKVAWCQTQPSILGMEYSGKRWDLDDAAKRRELAEKHDRRHEPNLCVGWFDKAINAAFWLQRAGISPDEAAMLMFCIDPLSKNAAELVNVDGIKVKSDRYQLLRRAYIDVAEIDQKPRTLLDWRAVAKREGLQYHKWIDKYVQAQFEEVPADAGSGGTGELIAPDTGPVWWRVAREEGNRWYAEKLKAKKKGDPPIEKNQLAEYLYGWLYSKGYRNRSKHRISLSSIREQITGIVVRKKVGMDWK